MMEEDVERDYALGQSHGETDMLRAELAKWRLSFPQGPGVTADMMAAKLDELAQVRRAHNAEMRASLGHQAELASLKEELAKLYVLLADEQAELARLREKERLFEQLEYRMTQENARLRDLNDEGVARIMEDAQTITRLREALTLIGRYHYSTREAKDLCDIANDALEETT